MLGLNLIAPINPLGYGRVGCEITKGLSKHFRLNLFPIGNIECHKRDEYVIRKSLENSDTFDYNAPCIRLWHQHDMSMFVGRGKKIGFPIFELDTLTSKERHHLNSCDALIVCSQWAREICLKNNVGHSKFFTVANLGYNPSIFFPSTKPRSGPVRFLNMGKWEIRKGHDILVRAFNDAFEKTDDVELLMCNWNPFYSEEQNKEWEKKYKESKLGHKIRIIPRLATEDDVADLMRATDCGIFPSRAEGFNLEAVEMMGCGKPVIMTDYAGQADFIDKEWAIRVEKLVDAYDGKWFFNQGKWAEPVYEDIVEQLRKFYRNPKPGKISPLTWDKTVAEIVCSI